VNAMPSARRLGDRVDMLHDSDSPDVEGSVGAIDVAFFAHYNPHGGLADYVVRYVASLANAGFAVVFISTSILGNLERSRLSLFCIDIMERENRGHDFGSWADALRVHQSRISGDLLLVNDSVYGPIGDLRPHLDHLRSTPADIRGWVETDEGEPHLQSWFLLLSPRVWQSATFARVIGRDFRALDRNGVIELGELGLSRELDAAGFVRHAAYSARRSNPMMRAYPANPTHWQWKRLLRQGGVPFIKADLLRQNPQNIPDLVGWTAEIEQMAPELARMIQDDLARRLDVPLGRPPSSAARYLIALQYACYNSPDGLAGQIFLCAWRCVAAVATKLASLKSAAQSRITAGRGRGAE
jgi:lipopolysaccharide biosynthesis protein